MSERFSPPVEAALREAGWYPGRRLPDEALSAMSQEIHRHPGRYGGTLSLLSGIDARNALAEFGGLIIGVDQPGVDVKPRSFALDPTLAAHSVETLIDAGRALDTHLSPLGIEGLDEAVLAIDFIGRVFAIDPTGEWFLGETIDAALETLITGKHPLHVDGDGNWPGRDRSEWHPSYARATSPTIGLKHPLFAAFYLWRTPDNLPYVWLPDILARLGTTPWPDYADPGTLAVTLGGLRFEAHIVDLDDFTVLVLAFEYSDWLTTDNGEAVAQAFRDACIALSGPDLDVAFVCTVEFSDPFSYIADQEYDVLTSDGDLVTNGYGLLYLSQGYALDADRFLGPEPREEMPIANGRLIFSGSGKHRW